MSDLSGWGWWRRRWSTSGSDWGTAVSLRLSDWAHCCIERNDFGCDRSKVSGAVGDSWRARARVLLASAMETEDLYLRDSVN